MAELGIRVWGGKETGICYFSALSNRELPIKEFNIKFKFFIAS